MKKLILIIICLSIIPVTKLFGKVCIDSYYNIINSCIGCANECWRLF